MPTYTNGELREFPRVNVTRGYAGNEPQSITKSAPVTDGVTILSGQPIELDATTGKWVLADNSSAMSQVYIAYHDSGDTDVQSCQKLLGFSVLGEFEIETPWVNLDGLAVGVQLKVSANGNLQADGVTSGGAAGNSVGYVTEIRDLGVGGHTTANARGGVVGTIPEDSTANGSYQSVLTLSGALTNAETFSITNGAGDVMTWTVDTGDATPFTSTGAGAGTLGVNGANGGGDAAVERIADGINDADHGLVATADTASKTITIVQEVAGSSATAGASAAISIDNLSGPLFTRGPARWVAKFVTAGA